MSDSERIQVSLKLRLTCAQEATLRRWLWHLTGVHNWVIRTVEREKCAGRTPTAIDLKRRINGHSRKMGMPTEPLYGAIDTARDAWERCFRRLAKRPKLRGSRRPLNSIGLPHGIRSWRGSRPVIYGIGPVRVHQQVIPEGRVGYARIVRRASGWYLCLFVQAKPKAHERVGCHEVGVDPGFASLLTLSTGEVFDIASELDDSASRLAQAQRGGRKRLAARLQERISNRRKNRNHHISRKLVSENTLIAFSKDSTAKIARRFGKSVASAGHAQLRSMLRYKSDLTGDTKYIEVPSRNSTRTCYECGALTGPQGLAGLKVRFWQCSACGSQNHRDVNAARNTLRIGRGMRPERSREAAPGIAHLATPRSPSTEQP